MLRKLEQLDLGHVHKRINFVFRPLEILNTEGIYGDDLDASLVAHVQYLQKSTVSRLVHGFFELSTHPRYSLKAQVVPFNRLDLVFSCKSSVSVHDKGDVSRYWALSESSDEEFSDLRDCPFCRRRL